MPTPRTAPSRLAAGTAALVACAALGVAAAASPDGGPPGGTARAGSATAAAVVDGGGRLVRGRNVDAVHSPGPAVTCVRLAAGIAPDTVVPLVTAIHSGDGGGDGRMVFARLVDPPSTCDGTREVEVATRDADGDARRTGFTLVVP
ncbi:hypothetical protein [Streptomyces avicenniae]|uniref:hypothetical protein n=1 Tax=Streptomyces avicenniae TaxID=500153 RepID=UPI00069B5847|nr:hypothetical protein [Streptomyces avicenniae]